MENKKYVNIIYYFFFFITNKIIDKAFYNLYLHTKVSTCVQGSPHFGQIRASFLPLSPPDPAPPPDVVVPLLLLGGTVSDGALAKLVLVVSDLLATTLTIL